EALAAQLLRSTGEADSYDFTHALIRHTLYAELNPSRQVRLHRRIAEAMEERSPERAADIAYHYHRSAAMSGAERGVAPALAAEGLRYAAERRDATWAALKSLDIQRAEAEDPDFPGHMLDTPERREVAHVVGDLPTEGEDYHLFPWLYFTSRAEVLARPRD